MSTQMFLRNEDSDLGGAGQRLLTAAAGQGQNAVSKVTNTASSGTNIAGTDTGGGTVQQYISYPLTSGVTISGSITVNIRGKESSTSANAGAGIKIERCDGSGNTISTVYEGTVPTSITEYSTSDAAKTQSGITPTSTSFSAGDRIRVTLEVRNVGTMASGFTVTNTVDGPSAAAGDTYVTFTETISESAPYPIPGPAGTIANISGSTITISAPAGATNGQLLVIMVIAYWVETTTTPTSAALTPPAGHTLAQTGVGDITSSAGGFVVVFYSYHYFATGETTYVYTLNSVGGTASGFARGFAVPIIGGPASGNPFLGTLQTATKDSLSTSITVSAFTPTVPNTLLLATMSTSDVFTTGTDPDGWSMQAQSFSSTNWSGWMSWNGQTTAVSTGALTFSISTSRATFAAVATIGIIPTVPATVAWFAG